MGLEAALHHPNEKGRVPMKRLLLLGLLLVATALPALLLQAREAYLDDKAHSRYGVAELVDAREALFEGNQITIETPSLRQQGQLAPVSILVNGRDHSEQPSGAERYRSTALATLIDHETRGKSLAVVEGWGGVPPHSWTYRVLFIAANGSVTEERFAYAERSMPLYRVLLARIVGPPVGFHSDVLQLWPGALYPIMYPWATGFLGLLCLVAAILARLRARDRGTESAGTRS